MKKWITFNEPFNFCIDGYSNGRFAPGIKLSGVGEYLCTHHVLQSHSAAYHLYREKFFDTQRGQIGISLNTRFIYAKDETVDEKLIDRVLQYRVRDFLQGY